LVVLPKPASDPDTNLRSVVSISEEADPRGGQAQGTVPTVFNNLPLSASWYELPSGNSTNQAVIVGGTPDEQSAIAHAYPHARILEIPTGASIEDLAQHLQELGVAACGPRQAPTQQAPHVFWLAPCDPQFTLTQESILAAQQQGVLACFRLIKALLLLGYAIQTLNWTVITRQARTLHSTETCDPTHASLLGLFGSLAKEYAHWSIQLIDLPTDSPLPLAEMLRLPADAQGHGWLYRHGHWYRQVLVPLDTSSFDTREAYRRGGVYVVIGGAGGIGEVWSEYLIRRYQAQIIWLGRRKTNADIEAKQERLAALGPRPQYITADATDRPALEQAYQEMKRNFGQIHGVVHSTIVLLDQSLAKMDEQRFQAALAAKVEVSVRLAQVFEHEPLDFVLFFSSLSAFVRNAGQSNYAAGCTFEDAFAARLRQDWSCAVKVMNWGYWGSVGVVMSPEYRKRMAQTGVESIEPAEAMEALEQLLAGPLDQMALLKMTQPITFGGEIIQAEETVTDFGAERLPSYIHILQHSNRYQDVQRKSTDAETRQGMQEMYELLYKLLWSQLQSLGLFSEKHAVLTNLREQAGISTSYDRWLQESVRLLEFQQYLHSHNTPVADGHVTYSVVNPTLVESTTVWQLWDQQKEHWMRHADLKAQVVLVETMLRALPAILTGKQPATEIMFPNGSMQLVEGIYQHNAIADSFNEILARLLVTYLQERQADDRRVRMRILEIGAGTGGTTSRVLQMLQPYQASIAEYCYSDISEAFLSYGQRMYGAEHPYLTYQLLNVEKPLAGQGIELGSYDLVIAANVLHATSNIRRTVRNVKAALKKRGLLLLNEITGTSIFSHLTFGLLSGWWAYEDPELRVPGCPALTIESWQAVLSSEGFNVISIPTQDMQEVGQQIIVAESDGVVRQALKSSQWSGAVGEGMGASPTPTVPAPDLYLQPRLTTDRMVFDHVQSIIQESIAEVLKVPERIIQEDKSFSEYGVDSIVALNLIDVINQKSKLTLQTTVLFDYNNVEQLRQYILREHTATLRALLQESALAGAWEVERKQQPSAIVRNIKRESQWRRFQPQQPPQQPEELEGGASHGQAQGAVPTAPTCQRVVLERPGGIDDLIIREADMPELKDQEVRIAVRAFALNFDDLLCVKGLYPTMPPYPFTPGFEASGVVLDVGQAVTTVRIGEPVMAIAGATMGGQASVMTCQEEHVFHKPAALSFEEACALPVAALTMIAAFEKARLKRGEKILIQTATGGTGLVAVQLAKYYQAQIYATAGSQLKLDYLKQLDVPYRINYQETDFAQEIERLTAGQGVDVVINTLSGDAIQKGMNCLAPGGRYIEIAMTALKAVRTIDLSVFCQNQTFYSIDLRKLGQSDPATFKHYCHEMLQLVQQGIITPTISQVFAWERLKDAYRYLENRQNIGKVVVRIPEANQVSQKAISQRIVTRHDPYVRYVSSESAQGSTLLTQHEPIAIIGMSGRFARSKNVSELWEHLTKGTDLVEEVSRWDLADLSPASVESKEPYCKHGSFLDGIDLFDPHFFNISELEATSMDPQQRLVLEEAWHALEDAGYVGTSIEGRQCGVYIGCGAGDYQHLFKDEPPAQTFWGNTGSMISARIAHYLNLTGPAIALDTACSSSLVAMHLACQGLWSGESEMALAGGVFVQCTPQFYRAAHRAGMLSLTGHCSTFDERADGFVPGEGVGVVVLKRLNDALASGDHIYGVIRASGINQGGTTKSITVPSANAQERLLRSVYETFQIKPEQIQMVEAHGTGTKLGDPLEYEGLTRTFRQYTDKCEYCALGSIKTNLGYTVIAAGVAGVIKILLSLRHKQIPPSLHFESGNAHIQFKESPFYVNTRLRDWSVAPGERRCAAVSAFGISGTNAHMVIEEAPEHSRRPATKPGYLIVLSARTMEQLRQQVEQLATFCECIGELDCGNMSYTLLLGRKHFKHRLACVVSSHKELGALLRKWLEKGKVPQVSVSNLENREQLETTSLKRYGNQCIEDCQQTTEPETYLEQLSAVADLYLQGYALAFEQLFAGSEYSRISLPTYPFARERYWITTEG
jgi:acyl transferase domain-containing protein/NADPH:quinone reductase-like Zn-dependent oxidoreductase/acyl carrier protein